MAWACGHPNKSHYSRGMCQNCYLAKYYIKRKQKQTKKLSGRELELIKDYEVTESKHTQSQKGKSAKANESTLGAKVDEDTKDLDSK